MNAEGPTSAVIVLEVATKAGVRPFPLQRLPGTVGSDPACDIRLKHPSVHSIHATVLRESDRMLLCVVGRGPAIMVAGRAEQAIELHDGMVLKIGDVPIRVRVRPSERPSPAIGLDADPSCRGQASPEAVAPVPALRAAAEPVAPSPTAADAVADQEGPPESGDGKQGAKAMAAGVVVVLAAVAIVAKIAMSAGSLDLAHISKEVWVTLAVIAGLIGLAIIIAGAARQVVVFYDGWDLLNSFGAFALAAIAVVCWGKSDLFAIKWIVAPLCVVGSVACTIYNYSTAAKHTRSGMLGAIIGTFKILFAAFAVISILEKIGKITSSETTNSEKARHMIGLAILVFVTAALINGRAVYEAKGWELPEGDEREDDEGEGEPASA